MKKFTSYLFFLYTLISAVESISQTPQLLPGFPIVIDSLNFSASYPILGDLDDDGIEDIIVSKNSPPFFIFAYNINGQVLNGWPQPVNQGTFSLAAGDLNGDGHLDVVARTTTNLYAFHHNGTLFSGFPQTFASNWDYFGRRQIALYDFHNNNTLDIVNATFNRVAIYHFDGSIHSGWPKTLPGKYAIFPSVADINRDGQGELVIGSYSVVAPTLPNDSGWIHVLNIEGNYLPGWPKLLDSNYTIFTPATIANINEDDSLEIIISSHYNIDLGVTITKINIFSPTGKLHKHWYDPSPDDYKDFGDIAIGDVNRDGKLEIGVSDRSNYNYIFDMNGNVLPGWPIEAYPYDPPRFVDIDNDTIPEIFLAYNASPGDSGLIFCFNRFAQPLPWSPIVVYGNTGAHQTVFSDLNKDGTIEMVTLGIALSRYNYKGYALSVYRFPNSLFSREGSPWPQLQHDRHNTYQYGYIPSDNIVGVPTSEENIPSAFSLAQNYPNPFNPKTTIHYTLSTAALVTLKVYDVLGREIATLFNNENKDAGKFAVQFDASNVSSGIYFYRLSVTQLGKLRYTETKKFVVMK
jgi:hypothetical protein